LNEDLQYERRGHREMTTDNNQQAKRKEAGEKHEAGEKRHNRLINEKSPYLLPHARNPVDWFPWSEEAFEKAQREDMPIFLSIGYSTCHWCHVMKRESFEDTEVAQLMNENFVCIKVDREERPDIDDVYMTVCQMMTGSGGWPLTIIMTSDKRPFFAATYIPKETRRVRTGMLELIPALAINVENQAERGEKLHGEDHRSALPDVSGHARGGACGGSSDKGLQRSERCVR